MTGVHHVYMAKKQKPKAKPLRWRKSCIRFWRERAGFTQQSAPDALQRSGIDPLDLVDTHASISRIENGEQMPSIGLIEGMVQLYGAPDIDSLLNRKPDTSDADPPMTTAGMLQVWDKAKPSSRSMIIDLAKRIVQTDT